MGIEEAAIFLIASTARATYTRGGRRHLQASDKRRSISLTMKEDD